MACSQSLRRVLQCCRGARGKPLREQHKLCLTIDMQKTTPALVVAQCYHMGPGIKIDPLSMLADAKRVCDTLVRSASWHSGSLLTTMVVGKPISARHITTSANLPDNVFNLPANHHEFYTCDSFYSFNLS